jgi:hypothetical protein
MASQHGSLHSRAQPPTKRRSTPIIIAVILTAIILVLIVVSWRYSASSQRRVIDALLRIGWSANERHGTLGEFDISYGFDEPGPRFLKRILDAMDIRYVIHIGFTKLDDQQLFESIPHLQRLPSLRQIGFRSQPDQEQLAKLRAALPGVTFYWPPGKML